MSDLPVRIASGRLASIDVLRGFDMFWIIGLNAIVIYVAQPILNVKGIASFFVGGLAAKCPAALSEVLLTAVYLLVCWCLVYWLHRNKIYFRV